MPLPKFANSLKAFEHYAKHVKGIVIKKKGKYILKNGGADMPFYNTQSEYIAAAQKFFTQPGKNVLTGFEKNGDKVMFDMDTGFFGVITKNNVIRTYFKPDDGVEYFLKPR